MTAHSGAAGSQGGSSPRKAIFLDRDGTLNVEVHYLADPERFAWIPGSREALRKLQDAGFALIVVTNQSGIAQGLLTEEILASIHARMVEDLEQDGVRLDGIYHCPHHPRLGSAPWVGDCDCRKPKPGMLLQAERECDLDWNGSWIVGDSLRDVEAGRALGLPGILVRTGKGAAQERDLPPAWRPQTHVVDDLAASVPLILADGQTGALAN